MPAGRRLGALAAALLAWFAVTAPVLADEAPTDASQPAPVAMLAASASSAHACAAGSCRMQLSPGALLTIVDRLVLEKRYDEARPFIDAMRGVPELATQFNFLDGLVALESGDAKTAEKRFRNVLKNQPEQTRVRLELARALFAQRKFDGADYQLRLAQDDEDLPEDIARIISNTRSAIRSRRNWRFGFDFGFAPDSNINSATSAESVDVTFGSSTFEIDLDEDARARSGIGATASMYGSLRLPASEAMALVLDANADMVRYENRQFNDTFVQFAAGPELRLGESTRLTLQGVAAQRWFGGRVATQQFGAQGSVQRDIDRDKRVALRFDARHAGSDFGDAYRGWQYGANLSYEQVMAKTFIASGTLYARREAMKVASNANWSYGINLGIGGELPFGLNAGVSGGIARTRFDKPAFLFSDTERRDWRLNGRAYVGLRQVRVAGFSPSVEYNFSETSTNYALYEQSRHRVEFKLARYF
jgi:hypothetical protein